MLGEVIGHVCRSFAPDELELILFDAVLYPVEAHVEGFGEFLAHGGVEDACSGGVIVVDGSALEWLGVI